MYVLHIVLNSLKSALYYPFLPSLEMPRTSLPLTMPKGFRLGSNLDYKVANLLHQSYTCLRNLE